MVCSDNNPYIILIDKTYIILNRIPWYDIADGSKASSWLYPEGIDYMNHNKFQAKPSSENGSI